MSAVPSFRSPSRFAALDAYVAQLPHGWDSYPECTARAAIYRHLLDTSPLPPEAVSQLPPPLAAYVTDPRPVSDWIPEVFSQGILLAILDWHAMDSATSFKWLYRMNKDMLGGRLYQILMSVASPELLMKGTSYRWGALRRGSTFATSPGSGHTYLGKLTFPPHLFAELGVLAFLPAFQAVLDLSHAKDAKVSLATHSATEADFLIDLG